MNFEPFTAAHLKNTDAGLVLLGTRVLPDGPVQFPPARVVHAGQQLETVPIGPAGTLYSFTTVYPGGGQAPYQLAMADFAPDIRVFGRLLSPARPAAIGMALTLVPFTLPDGTPDYAFETV